MITMLYLYRIFLVLSSLAILTACGEKSDLSSEEYSGDHQCTYNSEQAECDNNFRLISEAEVFSQYYGRLTEHKSRSAAPTSNNGLVRSLSSTELPTSTKITYTKPIFPYAISLNQHMLGSISSTYGYAGHVNYNHEYDYDNYTDLESKFYKNTHPLKNKSNRNSHLIVYVQQDVVNIATPHLGSLEELVPENYDGKENYDYDLNPKSFEVVAAADRRRLFRFNHWAYIDRIVMFGGNVELPIVIPSPEWINAAHKNGVRIYGNIMLPQSHHGICEFERLLFYDGLRSGGINRDDDGSIDKYPFARKLVKLAKKHGFDGWHINNESPCLIRGPHYAGFSDWYNYYSQTIAGPDTDLLFYLATSKEEQFFDGGVNTIRGVVIPSIRYTVTSKGEDFPDTDEAKDYAYVQVSDSGEDKTTFWAIEDLLWFKNLTTQGGHFYQTIRENADRFDLVETQGHYYLDFTQGYSKDSYSTELANHQSYEEYPYVSLITGQSILSDNVSWAQNLSNSSVGSYEHIYQVRGGGTITSHFSGLLRADSLNDIQSGDMLVGIPFNHRIDTSNKADFKIVLSFVNHLAFHGSFRSAPVIIKVTSKSETGNIHEKETAVNLRYAYNPYINVEIPLTQIEGDLITKIAIHSGGLPDSLLGTILLNKIAITYNDNTTTFTATATARICKSKDHSGQTEKYSVQVENRINDAGSTDPTFSYFLTNGRDTVFLGKTGNNMFVSYDLSGNFFSDEDDLEVHILAKVSGKYYISEFKDMLVSDALTVSSDSTDDRYHTYTLIPDSTDDTVDHDSAFSDVSNVTWKMLALGDHGALNLGEGNYIDEIDEHIKYNSFSYTIPSNYQSRANINSARVIYEKDSCVFAKEFLPSSFNGL